MSKNRVSDLIWFYLINMRKSYANQIDLPIISQSMSFGHKVTFVVSNNTLKRLKFVQFWKNMESKIRMRVNVMKALPPGNTLFNVFQRSKGLCCISRI